jgi:hypothetical protein
MAFTIGGAMNYQVNWSECSFVANELIVSKSVLVPEGSSERTLQFTVTGAAFTVREPDMEWQGRDTYHLFDDPSIVSTRFKLTIHEVGRHNFYLDPSRFTGPPESFNESVRPFVESFAASDAELVMKPPTASLFFCERETGIDRWNLVVCLSRAEIEFLVEELEAGRLKALTITLNWTPVVEENSIATRGQKFLVASPSDGRPALFGQVTLLNYTNDPVEYEPSMHERYHEHFYHPKRAAFKDSVRRVWSFLWFAVIAYVIFRVSVCFRS